jgi:hypothetical protein
MSQRKESKLTKLMRRVRLGKITQADRVTLRKHAARARRARGKK